MNGHATNVPWRQKFYPSQTCAEQVLNYKSLAPPVEEPRPDLPPSIRAVRNPDQSSPGGRTIIICLDGTGDQFDGDNSNVVNFVATLKKDDPNQLTYYQSGIGTYDGRGLKSGISALIDMAVGSGLGTHVKDAYRFIMENYLEGDKICLLGFSRGAYTVRCLAGMLHKVGLLPKQNSAQVAFAYRFYRNDTAEGWKMSAEFKKTFCTNVQVHFVGLWDCVASVGFIPRTLPFSKTPTNTIRHFRHAMALDEHRAKFKVCQWQHQDVVVDPAKITVKVESRPNRPRQMPTATSNPEQLTSLQNGVLKRSSSTPDFKLKRSLTSPIDFMGKTLKVAQDDKDQKRIRLEKQFEKDDRSVHEHIKTDTLEVWFTGAHADVGGGAVPNEERHMLSRIPLRWMIRQCFECETGIIFNTAPLAETGIDVLTVWPIYKTPTKPVVGPSPIMVGQYEEKKLPPLRRRSTALGLEKDYEDMGNDEKREIIANDIMNEAERLQYQADMLPEHVEDHFDAMAAINDQLVLAKSWWVLEFWPVKVRLQKKHTEEWEKVVRWNLGRYRPIREEEPKMHWTVQMRMNDKAYRIRNRVDINAIWQVAT
ncbi:hypothetical protein V499_08491 [Pseudogymnoascus sp. VKM F-103]|uniref:T6SS Phospholipase effector Tle1-like catalytic domain-containing protein n=1 Tax=Pseudogymnoascus verrucosus TaxID=342668 RepID=A0A1B8GNX3_9PEZI|nr:uncharacterized protein VE01_04578 [Pseudogymnoascus verrucosus]KFY71327.1 hypothetical protein V499_08491 [Pseudogymnoascus sp. VKM F-103]OBT97510.1 hypothetical protein VE01_04578 [Pseudogymnoascus verrucosus]